MGRIVRLKRVDILLSALATVTPRNWVLQIVGNGEEKSKLQDLAKSLCLSENVVFTGVLDNSRVRKTLAQSDVLILPSDFDGWGAVVNESLLSGTPVICSDYCGAADLIRDDTLGALFECNSVKSLA